MKTPRKEALQSGALSVFILVMVLLVWHLATLPAKSAPGPAVTLTPEQIEYQKLLGKDPAAAEGDKAELLAGLGRRHRVHQRHRNGR